MRSVISTPSLLTGDVFQHLLHNNIASAGISHHLSWENIDNDRRAVGRLLTIQYLHRGIGPLDSYPPNPPAGWLRSLKRVTFDWSVKLLAGIFHDFGYWFTSASRLSLPDSTKRNAAIAATGLLIDAA